MANPLEMTHAKTEERFGAAMDDSEYDDEYAEFENLNRKEHEKGTDIYDRLQKDNLKIFHKSDNPSTYMYYIFDALINKGYVKDGYFVRMKHDVISGREWQKISGNTYGMAQQACVSYQGYTGGSQVMNWNASINAVYRTLEISGWPKLVQWFEGPNWIGNDVVKGYGCVPLPIQPGNHRLRVNVFRPMPSGWWGKVFGFQKTQEKKESEKQKADHQRTEAEIIISGFGRDVTTVENMGYVEVEVEVTLKNFSQSGVYC